MRSWNPPSSHHEDPLTRPERPYNYVAVGATRMRRAAKHSLRDPRLSEERVLIGLGRDRWEHAVRETLSWGIQRQAGYRILPGSESPSRSQERKPGDKQGTALPPIRPGQTVRLQRRFGLLRMTMPVRIVYVLDEPRRKGFAFGTLRGHPVSGEAAFMVERGKDDSVWFILRSLSGPGRGLWILGYPMVLLLRRGLRNNYLSALAGPID